MGTEDSMTLEDAHREYLREALWEEVHPEWTLSRPLCIGSVCPVCDFLADEIARDVFYMHPVCVRKVASAFAALEVEYTRKSLETPTDVARARLLAALS